MSLGRALVGAPIVARSTVALQTLLKNFCRFEAVRSSRSARLAEPVRIDWPACEPARGLDDGWRLTGRAARLAASTLEQPYVARAWTLLRFLGCEFDPLSFTHQLEHRTTHGTAMEKVLDPTLI